jgi:multiple sugar transport system permease protein
MSEPSAARSRIGTRARRGNYLSRNNNFWGWLFIMPVVLGLSLWVAFPLGLSLVTSFTKWDLITPPVFVGFKNYIDMFNFDPLFWQAVVVTLYYTLVGVSLQVVLAFASALLLNTKVKGMHFFRTMFYLPSLVPVIVTSALWAWLYNPQFGLLNILLIRLGLEPQKWVYGTQTVVPSLILMSVWGVGNIIVIFLAGLQDIPKQLLEAVEIDGGNALHTFRHIIVPLMTPTILYNVVIGIINGFQTFTQPYIMTNGGPANASLFYVLHLYKQAFMFSKMGYASAMAWFVFIATGAISMVIFKTSKGWVFYQGEERK